MPFRFQAGFRLTTTTTFRAVSLLSMFMDVEINLEPIVLVNMSRWECPGYVRDNVIMIMYDNVIIGVPPLRVGVLFALKGLV